MRRTLAALLILAVVSTGCATASQRYVAFPTHGQPPDLQLVDRAQCEDIATAHKGSNADAAAAGALIGVAIGATSGAAIGALDGAIHGTAGQGSLIGLAVGGSVGLIVGITQAAVANHQRYEQIYLACMTARGYVLGG
jgi:hypothetical protein